MDAGLVRLAWVVLACVTLGMAAIFYAVLCAIMPSKVAGVAATSDLRGAPAGNAVPEELSHAVAKDLSQEARLLLEVRPELGPEYEEELVESFVDKVEESMRGRRAGQSRVRSLDASETLSGRHLRNLLALGLIAAGAFTLARNFGQGQWLLHWELALVLVAAGVGLFMLTRRAAR